MTNPLLPHRPRRTRCFIAAAAQAPHPRGAFPNAEMSGAFSIDTAVGGIGDPFRTGMLPWMTGTRLLAGTFAIALAWGAFPTQLLPTCAA